MCLSARRRHGVGDYTEAILPKRGAEHAHLADTALDTAGIREAEALRYPVDDKLVAVQFVPALFEDKRTETRRLTELRRTPRQTLEEAVEGRLLTLENLLHRLTVEKFPPASLCEMGLHTLARDMPAEQAVVPPLKGQGAIPDIRRLAQHRIQMLRALVGVYLELIRQHIQIYNFLRFHPTDESVGFHALIS